MLSPGLFAKCFLVVVIFMTTCLFLTDVPHNFKALRALHMNQICAVREDFRLTAVKSVPFLLTIFSTAVALLLSFVLSSLSAVTCKWLTAQLERCENCTAN